MTNKLAFVLALIVACAVGWDVFLNEAHWTTVWGRRMFLFIEELAFWR